MSAATLSRHSNDSRFDRTRLAILGILLAGFVLSFFHRTAPAAIAGELTQAFAINSAVLGTLAATYFFVYTLLQIPVGVLADTLGPRVIVTGGALVAGAGSLLFGLAPSWEVAAMGRTLVGVGKKDGKVHRYWRLVRSVRVGRRVIQQTVAQLGESSTSADGSKRARWRAG